MTLSDRSFGFVDYTESADQPSPYVCTFGYRAPT